MRRVLVLAAALAVALSAYVAPACADPAYPHLDATKVAQVQHNAALLHRLIQKTYPLTLTNADLITREWEFEILPYYAHEGIADDIVPPVAIQFYFRPVGPALDVDALTFHILGMSYCNDVAGVTLDGTVVRGPIFLNGRYINPVSPWYQDASYLWTLVHELGHTQGICYGSSDYVESSTQVASAEVMAAMVNSGNGAALLSLLDGWQEIVTGALYYDAIHAHAVDEYRALMDATDPDAKARARRDSSRRHWGGNTKGLEQILYKYELAPYVKIMYAVNRGKCLASSQDRGHLMSPHVLTPSGRPLCLDDFAYFLAHDDEIVEAWGT